MPKRNTKQYDLLGYQRHWRATSRFFTQEFSVWHEIFSELIVLVSDVAGEFEGQRQLPENCCYLLLSKALNHSLAAYSLIERGLVIDAALSARNALETLLMLELFVKDRSVDHFVDWANGKEYKPSYVRKMLTQLPKVAVGEVVIEVDQQYYEDLRLVYSWLSDITHPNLESLRYTVNQESLGSFQVFVGGNLQGQHGFVNVVFKAICGTFLHAVITCCAVFNLPFFELQKERFAQLSTRINETSNQ